MPWWELFHGPAAARADQDRARAEPGPARSPSSASRRPAPATASRRPTLAEGRCRRRRRGRAPLQRGAARPTPGRRADYRASQRSTRFGATLSWEIDFFGRIRRATEAQRALLLATRGGAPRRRPGAGGRRGTRLRRAARPRPPARDRAAHARVAPRVRASSARDRFEGGVTPELDLRAGRGGAAPHRVVVYDFERRHPQKENELPCCSGRNPGPILRGPRRRGAEAAAAGARRPALGAARSPSRHARGRAGPRRRHREHRRGQGAALPAHRADRVLRLREHGSRHALRRAEQVLEHRRATCCSRSSTPARTRRRVEIAESQQRQALYAYERTILNAFRETEDALVAYRKTGEQPRRRPAA